MDALAGRHTIEDKLQIFLVDRLLAFISPVRLIAVSKTVQLIPYRQIQSLAELSKLSVDFCAVGHKRVDKAVGCRAPEAVALFNKKRVCALSRGGNGSGDPGKASAQNYHVITHPKTSNQIF